MVMMNEKRFRLIKIDDYVFQIHDIDNDLYLVAEQICNLLNEQQATISDLKEENEQLRKENFFLGYWKRKAMILLMQVRRLTPRMTDKEVREFAKELEEDE